MLCTNCNQAIGMEGQTVYASPLDKSLGLKDKHLCEACAALWGKQQELTRIYDLVVFLEGPSRDMVLQKIQNLIRDMEVK